MTAPNREEDERLLVEAAQKDPGRFAELYDHWFIATRISDAPA